MPAQYRCPRSTGIRAGDIEGSLVARNIVRVLGSGPDIRGRRVRHVAAVHIVVQPVQPLLTNPASVGEMVTVTGPPVL